MLISEFGSIVIAGPTFKKHNKHITKFFMQLPSDKHHFEKLQKLLGKKNYVFDIKLVNFFCYEINAVPGRLH